MKKVFFAFVAATVVALTACNNKPAEEATEATTEEVAPAEEAPATEEVAAPVDSVATEAPAEEAPKAE